jgi:hypothetical protein
MERKGRDRIERGWTGTDGRGLVRYRKGATDACRSGAEVVWLGNLTVGTTKRGSIPMAEGDAGHA